MTDLLHANGAFAFFDYATSGAYVEIDMEKDKIDAIYLSPHKNLGGPGGCGMLVCKKTLVDIGIYHLPLEEEVLSAL